MMMTDRELLELAAKAAGLLWRGYSSIGEPLININLGEPTVWNPLKSNSDAFRLAVALHICVEFGHCLDDAPVVSCGLLEDRGEWPMTPNFPNSQAATRRAIVRAAAEIGKQMP